MNRGPSPPIAGIIILLLSALAAPTAVAADVCDPTGQVCVVHWRTGDPDNDCQADMGSWRSAQEGRGVTLWNDDLGVAAGAQFEDNCAGHPRNSHYNAVVVRGETESSEFGSDTKWHDGAWGGCYVWNGIYVYEWSGEEERYQYSDLYTDCPAGQAPPFMPQDALLGPVPLIP